MDVYAEANGQYIRSTVPEGEKKYYTIFQEFKVYLKSPPILAGSPEEAGEEWNDGHTTEDYRDTWDGLKSWGEMSSWQFGDYSDTEEVEDPAT